MQVRRVKQKETDRMCPFVFSLQLDIECICCCFPQSLDGLLEPSVCILRKLVYADSSLRHRLALHTLLLLTLLRGNLAR